MEKKMENEMETGVIRYLIGIPEPLSKLHRWGYIGFRVQGLGFRDIYQYHGSMFPIKFWSMVPQMDL